MDKKKIIILIIIALLAAYLIIYGIFSYKQYDNKTKNETEQKEKPEPKKGKILDAKKCLEGLCINAIDVNYANSTYYISGSVISTDKDITEKCIDIEFISSEKTITPRQCFYDLEKNAKINMILLIII